MFIKTVSEAIFNEGRTYAESQIAFGGTEPRESPLSGEWADDPDPREIALRHGLDDDEYTDAVLDEWEAGYFSAPWPERTAGQDWRQYGV